MTVNKTMPYWNQVGNSYTSRSTHRPARSTYSSTYSLDYRQRTSPGSLSLYKTSTSAFVSPPSRTTYTTTSQTLPAIRRTSNTVSRDRGLTSNTQPWRATTSYDTNYRTYGSVARRDSDRFSVVRSSTGDYSSSSSESASHSTRMDNANRETEPANARRGSNGNNRPAVKQLGGNPEDSVHDSDAEPKSDNRHTRRSPSMERLSISSSARAKRYQSVDRIGAGQLSPMVCMQMDISYLQSDAE